MGSGVILLKSNGVFSVMGSKLKSLRKRCAPTFVGFATRGGGHKVIVAKTEGMRGL
jgi:hypothetical protein